MRLRKGFASPDYFGIVDLVQRFGWFALITLELLILSALILATRCANYPDIFVGGNVYFTDADCYSRMTRVGLCAEHPGLIVRHHDFENFPQGTTPHTTAPLDYLILGLSALLRPFTAQSLDLAGALISPLFALLGGWFLWWWSGRMRFRYPWVLLVLYAISPILVHGTELGRPDHQSLLMLLVMVAICAEWSLRSEPTAGWGVTSGIAWGLALWVSAYEPLVLLIVLLACHAVDPIRTGGWRRRRLSGQDQPDSGAATAKNRRIGWIVFSAVVAIALLVERRLPSLSIFSAGEILKNWSRTIGELQSISLLNPIWFRWAGYMIVLTPILIWMAWSKIKIMGKSASNGAPGFTIVLLLTTFGLTIWQARWAYFFMSLFAIALPKLLELIESRVAVWIAFAISLLPILRDWDERLWPNESVLAARIEHRNESVLLRDLAVTIQSDETHAFLAPWWLSPSIAYWSRQPGLAGSSHESLDGIVDSARFFLAEDSGEAREVLLKHRMSWVFAYDWDRVARNSAAILGVAVPARPLCRVIDRTPSQAPSYFLFSSQNGIGKLFRVGNKR